LSVNEERSYHCLVVKFGGSSLADAPSILKAVKSVIEERSRGTQIAVVVSAMGKTTDHLLSTARQASGSSSSLDEVDDIIAMGERTSARVFAAALRARGERSIYLDPSDPDWPIITDDSFGNAKPILSVCDRIIEKSIQPLLNDGVTVVVPGFIGRTEKGEETTMGRGGSDVTAMILARALSADQIVLVTDVDGIMSADPKIIEKPRILSDIEIEVLARIADCGSKFVHKKALRYKSPLIDVKIINNARADLRSEGTIVRGSFPEGIMVESNPEASMAVTITGKALSESPETIQKVLQQIREFNVPIFGMSINHDSLILYLPMNSSNKLLEGLHSIVTADERTVALAVRQNLAFVSVKGLELEETPGIVSVMSGALSSANINIYGIFTITSSVLLFVDLRDKERAVQLIRDSIRKYTSLEEGEK